MEEDLVPGWYVRKGTGARVRYSGMVKGKVRVQFVYYGIVKLRYMSLNGFLRHYTRDENQNDGTES